MSRGRSTGRGEEEGLRRVDGDAPQVVRVRLHLVHSFERVVVVHAQLHVVLHSHTFTHSHIHIHSDYRVQTQSVGMNGFRVFAMAAPYLLMSGHNVDGYRKKTLNTKKLETNKSESNLKQI